MRERTTDILIIGGGTGGVAAALAATSLGRRVILTEPYPWLGGQLTSQGVPPDENAWIETGGGTRRYRQYREAVRQYYRDHLPLSAAARQNAVLNPGGGSVSRLCHDPRIGAAVIEQMLAPARLRGLLTVLQPYRPIAASTAGDRITHVQVQHTETGETLDLHAAYVLDATELGDLLPLAGVEYVSGAESQHETGEQHAVTGPAQPENIQAFTWCLAAGFDPDPKADHTIERPATYDFWRNFVPELSPPWCGRLLSMEDLKPSTLERRLNRLFAEEPPRPGGDAPGYIFWTYRQLIEPRHYDLSPAPHAATCVNWPMNDYLGGSLIDRPDGEVAEHLRGARDLSLSLLYWLQTEAPNALHDRCGYPGLYLRPDLMGTCDGLAQAPYIRESRRIRACFTVTEAHVGTEMRWQRPEPFDPRTARGFDPQRGPLAEAFDDSVGIGHYAIDLHPSISGVNYVDVPALPFQIPLGSLLPQRVRNLLPACKNLGVTHITNGCYRLHPVEWNIGEAAGLLAAHCLSEGLEPHQVREDRQHLRAFQQRLTEQGLLLTWPWQSPLR